MQVPYTNKPASVEAAREEIRHLQAQRLKARSIYWATIYLIGVVIFMIIALTRNGEKRTWAFVVVAVFFIMFLLAASGKITWRPGPQDRYNTKEEETDKRIAFLEGFIQAEENRK